MFYSLQDVLTMPIIKGYRVDAGDCDFTKIEVKHLRYQELPVDVILRPEGEALITTARGCENDPDLFFQFVQKVHDDGVVALIISNKYYDRPLPKIVEEFANANTFPIIRLEYKYRFADIIESAIEGIRTRHNGRVEFYESIQKQLLTAYLEFKTLDEAAAILAHVFKTPVVITDSTLEIKGTHGEVPRPQDGDLFEYFPTRVNIELKDSFYGLILLGLADDTAEAEELKNLASYVAMPLVFWFDRDMTIANTRQQLKDDFIRGLMRMEDGAVPPPSMRDRAEALGISLDVHYLCLTGRMGLEGGEAMTHLEMCNWAESNIGTLYYQIKKCAAKLDRVAMATYLSGVLVIYLEMKPGEPQAQVDVFLDALESRVSAVFSKLRFTWGISEIPDQPGRFARSFSNAKFAMDMCYREEGLGFRKNYSATGVYSLLAVLFADEGVQKLMRNSLHELIEYDRRKKTDLTRTFLCYVKNGGNVSQAAKELFFHRQTLLYQLNKIGELTNTSFKNHDDMYFLETCIRLYIYGQMCSEE